MALVGALPARAGTTSEIPLVLLKCSRLREAGQGRSQGEES